MKNKYLYTFGIIIIVIAGIIGFSLVSKNSKTEKVEASLVQLTVLAPSVWSGMDKDHVTLAKTGTSSVEVGSYIKTGEEGRALVVGGKVQVSIDYNSELIITDKTDKGSVMNLVTGATWSRVEKLLDKGEYSEIKTKNAVASVRGTSYGVYVKGDETKLLVAEGTVQFTPLDAEGNLQAGKSVYISAGNKAVKKGNEDFVVSELTFNDTQDKWFQENSPQHVILEEEEKKVPEKKVVEIKEVTPVTPVTNTQANTQSPVNNTTANSSGSSATPNISSVKLELTSVSPTLADIGSGETITLTGSGFKDVTKVLANKRSIPFEHIDDAHITIIAGEDLGADVYDITVVNSAGQTATLSQVLEIKELYRAVNEANR
jgi:hypothetical protein